MTGLNLKLCNFNVKTQNVATIMILKFVFRRIAKLVRKRILSLYKAELIFLIFLKVHILAIVESG